MMRQVSVLLLLFTAYSFLGWVCESVLCSVLARKWINRGFLNGPVCPVYGFGALLVAGCLSPLRSHALLLFLAATGLTSALEYLTGLALETLFHARYWDYSDRRFNLQGRVCLLNSLAFGLLGSGVVLFLHPFLLGLAAAVPAAALPFLAGGLLLVFLLDTALTVNAVYNLNGKLDELQKILDDLRGRAQSAAGETVGALQASLLARLDDDTRARLKALFERAGRVESFLRAVQRRILRAFPSMRALRNNESLQRVREFIQTRAARAKSALRK